MRWLIYAWTLSVFVTLSPLVALADSGAEIAPIESPERSASRILNTYLTTGQDEQNNNMSSLETREFDRGAECPRGSGRYCSNALPYCCRSASGSVYCAPNAGACTR